MTRRIFHLFAVILIAGCAGPAARRADIALIKTPPQEMPFFSDDMWYDGLEHALYQSLSYLKRRNPDTLFFFGEEAYSVSHIVRSLEFFQGFVRKRSPVKALNRFLSDHYQIYQSVGSEKSGNMLFTGYYEPILKGSFGKKEPFVYPVYARPEDLTTVDLGLFNAAWKGTTLIGKYEGKQVIPYPDRKAIDAEKRLEGRAAPLVYLKDPIDAFFLQIQGSGKVYLEDRIPLNIHYHISNGRPYRSIGKWLIENKKMERSGMSMQAIRAYLEAHPDQLQEILNTNPSYVFFRIEAEGPKGFLDVVLTPGRSLALDRRLFPPAGLAFIETEKPIISPDGTIQKWDRCRRFVVHQDTGGAIRGPGRADLFWGNGPYAEIAAGYMQHRGTLYFLVLKPKI